MINSLRIKNLGLIDDVEISLNENFNAITGETGAGKTMVLSAIDALLGKKISSSLISQEGKTIIEAEVRINNPEISKKIVELDLDTDDDVLIVSRSFSHDGKSKCIVGGRSIPATSLGDLMGELIFVHGQKDQIKMTRQNYALNSVDGYIGEAHQQLLVNYAKEFKDLQNLYSELQTFEKNLIEQEKNRDKFLQIVEDIQSVAPHESEDEEIVTAINNLSEIEKISAALNITSALNRDELVSDFNAALKALGSQTKNPKIDQIYKRLSVLIDDLQDISSQAASLLLDISAQDQDIDQLENRRAKLNRLMKLYGPTLAEVLENQKNAEIMLAKMNDPGDFLEKLKTSISQQLDKTQGLSRKISKSRESAAKDLSNQITQELKDLMLAEAEFHISVTRSDPKITGEDEIEFIFRANPRLPFGAISKIASGGELSRLMLAIEVVLAQKTSQQTMIFDEVDTGVGGKTAIEIGKRLKRLSKVAQVILVTHLPQIAAFADKNLVVEKINEDSTVRTDVKSVSGDGKVLEISRMLAGLEGSKTALGHAEELIEMAKSN
jgi:DNA repair protein RecN (Recombination protein N)